MVREAGLVAVRDQNAEHWAFIWAKYYANERGTGDTGWMLLLNNDCKYKLAFVMHKVYPAQGWQHLSKFHSDPSGWGNYISL